MLTKVCVVKAMVFPVVMYGCESWTIKKAEHRRIDAYELWFWGRLLRVLECKKVKSVNPKENQPWILIGRTDVGAPILWPPAAKSFCFPSLPGYSVFYPGCCSFVSHSLQPHGLQHTRLPCPSLSPGVCSNSCPMSWWCHPTISFSVVPFSSCPHSFPASGYFPMSQLFTSGS